MVLVLSGAIVARLTTPPPRIRPYDGRRIKPAPKEVDPELQTAAHREWRQAVGDRAGWKCEVPGCRKAHPRHVMYADHIVERQDGGKLYDVENGQMLCASHHTAKTNAARARRMRW